MNKNKSFNTALNTDSNNSSLHEKADPFEGHTPLMRQYLQFKQKVGNALLFFRVGDFYELFLDDAKRAHELLGLTLTARGSSAGEPIAMSGVPWMALDAHLQKLIKMGHCAAVVDQMPQTYLPDGSKAPIERSLTKLVTPGTIIDEALLDDHEHPLLICCLPLFCLPEAPTIKQQIDNSLSKNLPQNTSNSTTLPELYSINSPTDRVVVFGSVASASLTCTFMNNIQWLEFLSSARAREILYPNNCSVMSLFWGSFNDPTGEATFANLCVQSPESASTMRFAKSDELKLFTQTFFQGTISAIEPHYFEARSGLAILQKHFADYPFALQTLGIAPNDDEQDVKPTAAPVGGDMIPTEHVIPSGRIDGKFPGETIIEAQNSSLALIKTVNIQYLENVLLYNKDAPFKISKQCTALPSTVPGPHSQQNDNSNNEPHKFEAFIFTPTPEQRNKCVEIKKTIKQQLLQAHFNQSKPSQELHPISNNDEKLNPLGTAQHTAQEPSIQLNLLRPYLQGTIGAFFEYVRMALSLQKAPIEQVLLVNDDGRLQIDAASVRALEIFSNSNGNYAASGSLLYSLGNPPTSSSKRLMGQLLATPLSNLESILMRSAILHASAMLQSKLPQSNTLLQKISESKIDLERYCAKINVQNIPNSQYPELIQLLTNCQELSNIVCTKDSALFWTQSTNAFLKEKTIGLTDVSFEKLQNALQHYFKCLAFSLKESQKLLSSLKILLHPALFKQKNNLEALSSQTSSSEQEDHDFNTQNDANIKPTSTEVGGNVIPTAAPVGVNDTSAKTQSQSTETSNLFANSLIDYLHPNLDNELSTLKLLAKDVNLALEDFCLKERQRSGIPTLKIDSIKNQGFFITVPRSQVSKVPQDYQLASTLKSAQRYKLDSLDALERKSSDAKLRLEQITRQYQILFNQLLLAHSSALGALGWSLDIFHLSSHLDLFNHAIGGTTKYVDIKNYNADDFKSFNTDGPSASFENQQFNQFLQQIPPTNACPSTQNIQANLSVQNTLTTNNQSEKQLPISSKEIFVAKKMYHPSILFNHIKNDIQQNNFHEKSKRLQPQLLDNVNFVPNDLQLLTSQSLLITGPNMGGKSTFMRSAALCAYLAACGLPISAKEFIITPKKSIFCRIGAQDDLSAGQSTFMVEMLQSAKMLQNANEQSFCIVDEIGRGTSTYDGVSIAFGALHHLVHHNRAQSLFCTHYFELTEAAPNFQPIAPFNLPAVKQSHFEAIFDDKSHKLHFTHKLLSGATNKSYGLDVAKMALIPTKALHEAKQFLHFLHQNDSAQTTGNHIEQQKNNQSEIGSNSTTVLSVPEQNVLDLLKNLQIDEISPKLLYDKIYEALKNKNF